MNWPMASLGEVTTKIGSGSTPLGGERSYKVNGIPFVRSMNVHDGEFVGGGLAYLDEYQAAALKHVALQAGDVLLNITGASVARVCKLPDELCGGRVNQHVSIVRPDVRRLDASFLAHLLRAPEAKARLLRVAGAGATREAITKAQIEEFKIPLPPLSDQRRIATMLDKADALRRRRRQALELFDHLSQAIFSDMFGQYVQNFSALKTSISDACEKITDGTHHSPKTVPEGVPYITAKHVSPRGIVFFDDPWFVSRQDHEEIYKRCNPEKGDVLYIKDGATTGIAAQNYYDFPFSMLSSLALLKPRAGRCEPEYLVAWLNDPLVKQYMLGSMSGAAITRLTLAKIKVAKIALPPISQQRTFARIVIANGQLRQSMERAQRVEGSLFASLQSRAFSGRL